MKYSEGSGSIEDNNNCNGSKKFCNNSTNINNNNGNVNKTSPTLFCEQVSTVTSLFEKWNDCERTVVMYALLKRLRYPSLKFLQYSIESNLTQNFGSQNNLTTSDINANNPIFLKKLVNSYKSFSDTVTTEAQQVEKQQQSQQLHLQQKPQQQPPQNLSTIIGDNNAKVISSNSNEITAAVYSNGNDRNSNNSNINNGSSLEAILQEHGKLYANKEEILSDILEMLPLLQPGNEEAKGIYLSLIPLAVEDTVRQVVATDLVQQIFSYLLIHPAITNEDRKSLSYWLRHLEEHIQSSFDTNGQQSFYVLSNPLDTSSTSDSISSMSSANSKSNWQAIAPPSQSTIQKQQQQLKQNKNVNNKSTAGFGWFGLQMPESLCEDLQLVNLTSTIKNDDNTTAAAVAAAGAAAVAAASNPQNSLGLIYDGAQGQTANCNESTISNDDHHVSFSKNGTEIIDFDMNNCDNCNTQIGFNNSPLLLHVCDKSNVTTNMFSTTTNDLPEWLTWNSDNKLAPSFAALKTRRSNSLTTAAISSSSSSASSVITVNDNCSNSSENLAQYAQKPRSYSLSIENPRGSLASSGSDTRLDDLKPNYLKFTTLNIGMSNIGQWLKSLRLHKYIGLFTNTTYENMLEITEDYLQSLGVTKGASHKLALCIEKLKDRLNNLTKIEQDLIANTMTINSAIDELTNIVLTPMKPADMNSMNVAAKFLHVLDYICHTVAKKEISSAQDEDAVNALLWILERSIHSEAFVAHTNQLKEHKFKISKLKMQFAPKSHHSKNGSSNSLNKPRWNGKGRKNDKCGSNDRIHRKNSNDTINFTSNTFQNAQSHQNSSSRICNDGLNNYGNSNTGSTCPQYKSSSYPNFSSNSGKVNHQQQNQQQQATQNHLQQMQQQTQHQQQQYRNHHRHSLNNLIVVSTVNAAQQQQAALQNLKMNNQSNSGSPGNGNGIMVNLTRNNSISGGHCTGAKSVTINDCNIRRSSLSITTTSSSLPALKSEGGPISNLISSPSTGFKTIVDTPTTKIQMRSSILTLAGNLKNEQFLQSMLGSSGGGDNNGFRINPLNLLQKNTPPNVILNNDGDIESNNCKKGLNLHKANSSSIAAITNNANNNRRNSSALINSNNGNCNSNKCMSGTTCIADDNETDEQRTKVKSSIGDINSSLEFLCLQMTEQAIN